MADGEQGTGGEAQAGGEREQAWPGWTVPGSEEHRQEQQFAGVVSEFPELAQPEVAQAASVTAAHLATQLGDPSLVDEPAMLAAAHALNVRAAYSSTAQEEQAQAEPEMDQFDRALNYKRGSAALPWH